MQMNLKQKGNEYYKQGEYALAANMYRRYVSKPHPDNKNAYNNLALCYYKLERYDECIEACKEALRVDPTYLKVYYRMALAYEKTNSMYRCFANAMEFCTRSEDGAEGTEMKVLADRIKASIIGAEVLPMDEKNRIFMEGIQQPGDKKEKKDEYFKGYTWADVQEMLEKGEIALALDRGYSIVTQMADKKWEKQNLENLRIVKLIRKGQLPVNTPLVQINNTTKPEINGKKQQKTSAQATLNQVKQQPKSIQQQQPTDPYLKYFLNPLTKKQDVFEGFPDVVISILKNQKLPREQKSQILFKASSEYPMFMALQLSLTSAQKSQIRALMPELDSRLADLYCQ